MLFVLRTGNKFVPLYRLFINCKQNHFYTIDSFIRIPPSGNWGPACGDSEQREENSDKISFSVTSACPAIAFGDGGWLCGEIAFGQEWTHMIFYSDTLFETKVETYFRVIRKGRKAMKVSMGAKNCLYPLPVTLVGSHVNGKPNFNTIAHVGIMDLQSISLGMNKIHYTNAGIKSNGVFSVNIPSEAMVKETDYCGLVSGKKVDKAALFELFYGELDAAPMIKECPINMTCKLVKVVDFPKHDIFIGEIVETFCDDQCLSDGVVDFEKVRPMLFTMDDQGYWRLGERFAKAWHIGKALKQAMDG